MNVEYKDYKYEFGTYMWETETMKVIDDYDETTQVSIEILICVPFVQTHTVAIAPAIHSRTNQPIPYHTGSSVPHGVL